MAIGHIISTAICCSFILPLPFRLRFVLLQMKHCGAVERLYPLLQQGPTIRHHVARALVYLGEIDTKGVSVFHRSNGECVCVRACVYVCT